jgi:hypothetical protein
MIRGWLQLITPRARSNERFALWVGLVRIALFLVVGLSTAATGYQRPAKAAETRTLRVAAAADLKVAFADIVAAFERQNPDVKVEVTLRFLRKLLLTIVEPGPVRPVSLGRFGLSEALGRARPCRT